VFVVAVVHNHLIAHWDVCACYQPL